MRRVLLLVCSLAALTACNQQTNGPASRGNASPAPAAESARSRAGSVTAPTQDAAAPAAGADASARGDTVAQTDVPRPPNSPVLAFDYSVSLVLPTDEVRPMMESHQEACERAGSQQCQVMSVESHADRDNKTSGTLTVRGTPTWLRVFRARVEGDVRDARGRILSANTQGEDVAPTLTDSARTDNQLSAQLDQLRAQLRQNPDDGELQRQISETQSQIDQARDARSEAQGRVQMATLTLEYQAEGTVAPTGVTAPLAEATRNFWSNTAQVAAVIVNLASILLPIALVVGPIWWIVAWSIRRRRAANPPASPLAVPRTDEPPPPTV